MQVNDLAEIFAAAGLEYKKFDDVPAAYMTALKDSGRSDLIFVGGSTFIVADFLESL
jgi:folylpolyglutamate synthase/dihydropteroate synthase